MTLMRKLLTAALLSLLLPLSSLAQHRVSGWVTEIDEQGRPLPVAGATVMVKGSSTGVVTASDGKFEIPARREDVLVFSCLGYEDVEEPVGGKTEMRVRMKAVA